jgi:hypothetical protein
MAPGEQTVATEVVFIIMGILPLVQGRTLVHGPKAQQVRLEVNEVGKMGLIVGTVLGVLGLGQSLLLLQV